MEGRFEGEVVDCELRLWLGRGGAKRCVRSISAAFEIFLNIGSDEIKSPSHFMV